MRTVPSVEGSGHALQTSRLCQTYHGVVKCKEDLVWQGLCAFSSPCFNGKKYAFLLRNKIWCDTPLLGIVLTRISGQKRRIKPLDYINLFIAR